MTPITKPAQNTGAKIAASTIFELLSFNAIRYPDKPAILGTSGETLTHAQIFHQIRSLAAVLRSRGISCDDHVVLLLSNGPTMAVVFLAVSSVAVSIPLNPGYTKREFAALLADGKAQVIISDAAPEHPIHSLAGEFGIPVWRIRSDPNGFRLQWIDGDDAIAAESVDACETENVALILHTSGTTSRPKRVPLSHHNLTYSAFNIASTLDLTPNDCCLNIMPLFNSAGLVGGLLAPLTGGGSVICPPDFSAEMFFSWVNDLHPSWYFGAPTMHQAILAEISEDPRNTATAKLRFIRSASAPLPPNILHDMERRWRVPVIESYGMTETATQVTSNPLPPAKRKPGSTGLPAGAEIAILNENGKIAPQGEQGEIMIRGENVTSGYIDDPEENSNAFVGGWFRSGDQGYFDSEGYLFITGRLKETINRGGEKIAPREVDEVFMEHRAVQHAIAFAVPHRSLGEDLVLAVVVKTASEISEQDLIRYAAEKLARFKLPSKIIFIDEIPKGPTGKFQRISLHEKLADKFHAVYYDAVTEQEKWVASTFAEVLKVDRVGRFDNFFALGGDSLQATRVVNRLGTQVGRSIPITTIFQFTTPVRLGKELERLGKAGEADIDLLVEQLASLSEEEIERLLLD